MLYVALATGAINPTGGYDRSRMQAQHLQELLVDVKRVALDSGAQVAALRGGVVAVEVAQRRQAGKELRRLSACVQRLRGASRNDGIPLTKLNFNNDDIPSPAPTTVMRSDGADSRGCSAAAHDNASATTLGLGRRSCPQTNTPLHRS